MKKYLLTPSRKLLISFTAVKNATLSSTARLIARFVAFSMAINFWLLSICILRKIVFAICGKCYLHFADLVFFLRRLPRLCLDCHVAS